MRKLNDENIEGLSGRRKNFKNFIMIQKDSKEQFPFHFIAGTPCPLALPMVCCPVATVGHEVTASNTKSN